MEGAVMANVRIGTAGWHYKHWRGPYYAADISSGAMLTQYCRDFTTVEINNSFYHLPSEETLADWRETVPGAFCFSVKASRYITHMKKLKDFEEPLATFLDRVDLLGGRLGPVLFQLPPRWHFNPGRLASFLAGLPDGYRFVLEFRNPEWYDRRAFDMLTERNVALCLHDMQGSTAPREVTADFVYVRLHGPRTYGGAYDTQTLAGWAGAFSAWMRKGCDVFCYFNNDAKGHAVRNARELKNMLHV
jgi:uncharacterized protein YecE (DUF72 family)